MFVVVVMLKNKSGTNQLPSSCYYIMDNNKMYLVNQSDLYNNASYILFIRLNLNIAIGTCANPLTKSNGMPAETKQ